MEVARRSANYKPSSWSDDFLQSLTSIYGGGKYKERAKILKEEVIKIMLKEGRDVVSQLEIIDVVQRLGISYHFEDEIDGMLKGIYEYHKEKKYKERNHLYVAALQFRLLREHGFFVLPQDIFNDFIENEINFKTCICDNIKGMLYLYEASFVAVEGETILDIARDFTTKHLKENLERINIIDQTLGVQVRHALELPFHWRMPRLEARWFIDAYEKTEDMDPILLEFAKLDFNTVQASHQEEIKQVSRWYSSTRLPEKLRFARDRMVECYFWTIGLTFEPQFGYNRMIVTKFTVMVTIIDDLYDVYGTLDELQLFTNAIDRWDIKEMEQIPSYLRICFLALFNLINELVYYALKEQDCNISPSLHKVLVDYCKSILVEAKWYHKGYKPTLSEYLESAWLSVAGPFLMVAAYFAIANPITKEAMESIELYPSIVRWPSMILRLTDDLATSSDELKRGDVPKSIQCYMHDTGACEKEAREHVKHLISETLKKVNNNLFTESPFPKTYVRASMNLARISLCMYQFCDGHGAPTHEAKERVLALLVNPIPI
ncbi:hypothetical protein LguiA_015439 [Lonicera macranthoides]